MANHFVSVNKGKTADRSDLFNMTTGTSSTTTDDIELRIADGASLSRKDVILALEKFEAYFENPNTGSSAFILTP